MRKGANIHRHLILAVSFSLGTMLWLSASRVMGADPATRPTTRPVAAATRPTARPDMRSEQERQTAAKTDIANLQLALDVFEIDCGRYPTNAEGLRALMDPPRGLQNWHGPYIRRMPTDPWGNPYVYRYPGINNAAGYDLFSLGTEGREGPNNITNWKK